MLMGWTDPDDAYVVGFARALATTPVEDLPAARAAVCDAVLETASGPVARVDGDALGLPAELARVEGDTDVARELIMHTGHWRSPASVEGGQRADPVSTVRRRRSVRL